MNVERILLLFDFIKPFLYFIPWHFTLLYDNTRGDQNEKQILQKQTSP